MKRYTIAVIILAYISFFMTASAQTVSLPTTWVNSLEYAGTTSHTITFPVTSTGGSWVCSGTTYGPYIADATSSLQQAINDAETCRKNTGAGTQINIPAGHLFSNGFGLTLPQTAGDVSTNFIVLQSTAPLPTGQTVCSHGIQDNVPASTKPGIRNPGCNSSHMSYQNGTTITALSGAFTLANGAATNTSAYNDVASMWRGECTSVSCDVINTAAADVNGLSPHHFAILNASLGPPVKATLTNFNAPVRIGTGTETAPSMLPNHIHLGYSFIHADCADAPVSGGVATGPPTCTSSIARMISFLGCMTCSVSYSYLGPFVKPGGEPQAIYLLLAQQIKVVHNWLEGGSEGLFSGGYSHTISIANFVTATDLEDRANRYTYPYSWMLAAQAGFCVNGLGCGGNGYVRKNAHELKVGNRVLDDGNILENVDNTGGQNGILESWKTDNNSINSGASNYWIINQNLTKTNGIGRNACEGYSWGFRAAYTTGTVLGSGSNGGGVAGTTMNALFQNNLIYNVGTSGVGCSGTSAFGFRVNNTGGNTWTVDSAVRDGAGVNTTYTLHSEAALTQSNMSVGDPGLVKGCTDTSFNTSTTTLTLALGGTVPTALTVVLPDPGTPNATLAAGSGCLFGNGMGWPRYLTFNHNSEFFNGTPGNPESTAGNSGPYQLSRNLHFTNSFMFGNGPFSSWGEGTRTLTKGFDGSSAVYHDIVHPGRDTLATCPGHGAGAGGITACYTEYSDTSVASSPSTIYGADTSNCTGTSVTGCVAVVGGMSQVSFPSTLSDWHDYRLCNGDSACGGNTSVYVAGQARNAADGLSMGADLTKIDAAQISTQYVCGTACGGGPFSDTVAVVTDLVASPTSIIFANQQTNVSSGGATVTATNTTGGVITISSIVLTSGTQFSIFSNTCGGTLAGSATCVVTIKFTPTSIGSKSDSLVFTDSGASSPQSVSLGGTGVSTVGQPQTQD